MCLMASICSSQQECIIMTNYLCHTSVVVVNTVVSIILRTKVHTCMHPEKCHLTCCLIGIYGKDGTALVGPN